MSWAALSLDLALAVLLVGVAILGWRLDRRLRALRSGADGLRDTLAELGAATDRAEAALRAFHDATDPYAARRDALAPPSTQALDRSAPAAPKRRPSQALGRRL